jgi:hypothetical protein
MFQKDYILRIIEDFFRFLSVILKLRSEKKYTEALQKCDETSLSLLRIDMNTIEKLPSEELKEYVEGLSLAPQQIEILAGLLYEKSEIHYETNSVFSAKNSVDKSLLLYLIVSESTRNFSVDADMKIRRLKELAVDLNSRLKDC